MRKLFALILCFATCFSLVAQMSQTDPPFAAKVDEINDKLIEWRRYFHENPELSNREYNTAKKIAEHLSNLGLEVKTGVGKTGVVALLKGDLPGPVIGLRADIDALPVTERVDVPYASKAKGEYQGNEVGVSHACGHDSHIAILMATAEILTEMKSSIRGTIKFVFQPAEEGPPEGEEGGAPLMIKEGVMENPKVDVMFGLHINSQTPVGTIKFKPGATMASSDWFTINVKGKQTHGSQPWAGVDPIVVSSQIIQGLQTIVSRQSRLTDAPVVITVGIIKAGVRANIIPESAYMEGTIRTLDSDMQKDVHKKIKRTVELIAESAGAEATVNIDTKTAVTFNDHNLTNFATNSLKKVVGENLVLSPWTTGAEDFSFYGEHAPSFFFFLGGMTTGDDDPAPHHTPDFFIDDSGLHYGVRSFCQLVFDYGKEYVGK